MTSRPKEKGKSYENQVAQFLTEQYGDRFMRVPGSGAYVGGSNRDRRLTMTTGQIRTFKGDIIPPDDWNNFNCETKFYKEFRFHLLYTKHTLLDEWINEVEATADQNDVNLIFMKFNRLGEFVAYQPSENFQVDNYTKYQNNWNFTSLGTFWNSYNKDIIHKRCTQS
jgi:hypothetical protein